LEFKKLSLLFYPSFIFIFYYLPLIITASVLVYYSHFVLLDNTYTPISPSLSFHILLFSILVDYSLSQIYYVILFPFLNLISIYYNHHSRIHYSISSTLFCNYPFSLPLLTIFMFHNLSYCSFLSLIIPIYHVFKLLFDIKKIPNYSPNNLSRSIFFIHCSQVSPFILASIWVYYISISYYMLFSSIFN
jgi:hypothetical protein